MTFAVGLLDTRPSARSTLPIAPLDRGIKDRDARDAGPWVAGAILAGWAVAGLFTLFNHQYRDAAIAAAAGWLTFVLLIVALLNLYTFWRKAPGERLWPQQRLPAVVRPILAPAAFLVGILLGRLIWQ